MHKDTGVHPRPELEEHLQKYHMCKVCNLIYEFDPVGGTASAKDLLKDNLNWVSRVAEGQYPSVNEKRYCRDLQDRFLSFLEMVSIYQKSDELYTMDGYRSKFNLRCYPNLPVPIPTAAMSLPTAVTEPPAKPHSVGELAEQPDEEIWKDDSTTILSGEWWPGMHRYRENLLSPLCEPLLTEDKQFICAVAYPSILTGGAQCPLLQARLMLGKMAIDIVSALSPLQQSWLLANEARFGWHDGLLFKWARLGTLASHYPKTFPARTEVQIYNNKA